MSSDAVYIRDFADLGRRDGALVGGKNASLGEMVRQLGARGIRVPPGFATSADAYRAFLAANDLNDHINATMADLEAGKITLQTAGRSIREAIVAGDWPEDIHAAIAEAYDALSDRAGQADAAVAVRSSATAEDLPDASSRGSRRPSST